MGRSLLVGAVVGLTVTVLGCGSPPGQRLDANCIDCSPPPPPQPPQAPQPRPDVDSDIALENTTGRELDVQVLSTADGTMIDDDMLRSTRVFAIPELHFPTSSGTVVKLSPQEVRLIESGAITVVDSSRKTSETRRVVVVEVQGTKAMLVGKGIVVVKSRGSGGVDLTSEWNAVQIIPLDRNVGQQCDGPRTRLTLPAIPPAAIGKRFVVARMATATAAGDAGECMTILANPEDASLQPFDLELCGPATSWTFQPNDVVVVERPTLIEDAPDGVRFVRASDAKAVELAHVKQRGHLFMQPADRVLALDTNPCAVPEKPSCSTLTIRTKLVDQATRLPVTPGTPLAMRTKPGSLFVLGGTRSLYALSCAEDFSETFDVVAHSAE